jgi:hypothetical protein
MIRNVWRIRATVEEGRSHGALLGGLRGVVDGGEEADGITRRRRVIGLP